MDADKVFIVMIGIVVGLIASLLAAASMYHDYLNTSFDVACVKSGQNLRYTPVPGESYAKKECR